MAKIRNEKNKHRRKEERDPGKNWGKEKDRKEVMGWERKDGVKGEVGGSQSGRDMQQWTQSSCKYGC